MRVAVNRMDWYMVELGSWEVWKLGEELVGFFAGEPDGVGAAFAAFVGGGYWVLADIESGFTQGFCERFVAACRPYGKDTATFQCLLNFSEAIEGVERVVFLTVECGRAVVNVEDDDVVVALRLADEFLDGLELDVDAGVVKEVGVKVGEVGAVPVHDSGGEFRNGKASAFCDQGFGGSGEGVSHSETADENFWLPDGFEGSAGKFCEDFLGTMGEAGHERLTFRGYDECAIVFDEFEWLALGGGGRGKFLVRFHKYGMLTGLGKRCLGERCYTTDMPDNQIFLLSVYLELRV